jgi:hypothetical protein
VVASDVIGEIAARAQTLLIVELVMDASIDSTAAGFLRRRPEAGERARDAGRTLGPKAERHGILAEEVGQGSSGGTAEGAVPRSISRKRRRRQQRFPGAVRCGVGVVIAVGLADGRDGTPVAITELPLPTHDGGVGHADIEQREQTRVLGQGQPTLAGDDLRDLVPVARRRDGAFAVVPKQGDKSLFLGSFAAGAPAQILDFAERLGVGGTG